MKKLLTVLLAAVMVFAMAACGGGGEKATVDMSKFPSDLNEWTAQDFNDYFEAAGCYTDKNLIYIQDHATYYAGTPYNECGGYMDEDGLYFTGVWTMNPDDSEGSVSEVIDYVRENKTLPEEFGSLPVDHLIGNFIFVWGLSSDEDFYNSMETAYNDLVEALGVTPDF